MKRSITRWTTAFAAAAFFGLPAAGLAQMTPAQPPATTTSTPATTPKDTMAAPDGAQHLAKAKAALAAIPPTAVTGRAKTQIVDLKRHLAALERASAVKGSTPAPRAAAPEAGRSNSNWGTDVAAMDKILAELLGTATTTGAGTSATTGTTGTPATPSKPAPTITIDEATRTQLTEVRMHLTAYAMAMSGAGVKTPEPAPADPSVTQPPVLTTAPPMTTLPATTSTPAQPPVTGQPPVPTPSATTPPTDAQPPTPREEMPAARVDQEAARRDLIAARDTLNQLTQLPAAAQLSGDARTQVTQLIANFNELITTESDWPASYVKVAANMTALLGPDNSSPEATGGVPTTPTGTTGAVGTSGMTTTVTLDPAVREKLVEMRKQLNAFEKASGVIKK